MLFELRVILSKKVFFELSIILVQKNMNPLFSRIFPFNILYKSRIINLMNIYTKLLKFSKEPKMSKNPTQVC